MVCMAITDISRKWRIIGGAAAAVTATAVAGSAATKPDSWWYVTRRKPSFQPPKWTFPVAWTALYADIAAVTGLSLADLDARGNTRKRTELTGALALNLGLNASWSAVFFRGKNPALATFTSAALTASSADLARRCMDVDSTRGAWLLPYPAWCAFATALSAAIWKKN